MNITEFRNGLKLIASLDRDEITKAIGRRLALSEWTYWLAKPNRAFSKGELRIQQITSKCF